jgi:hypothetical protein
MQSLTILFDDLTYEGIRHHDGSSARHYLHRLAITSEDLDVLYFVDVQSLQVDDLKAQLKLGGLGYPHYIVCYQHRPACRCSNNESHREPFLTQQTRCFGSLTTNRSPALAAA